MWARGGAIRRLIACLICPTVATRAKSFLSSGRGFAPLFLPSSSHCLLPISLHQLQFLLSLPRSNNWLIFTMYLQGVTPAADPIESKQTADAKYDPEDPELLKPVQPINNQYVDPFAHEESSEVKYKTLQWWYVKASPRVDIYAPS